VLGGIFSLLILVVVAWVPSYPSVRSPSSRWIPRRRATMSCDAKASIFWLNRESYVLAGGKSQGASRGGGERGLDLKLSIELPLWSFAATALISHCWFWLSVCVCAARLEYRCSSSCFTSMGRKYRTRRSSAPLGSGMATLSWCFPPVKGALAALPSVYKGDKLTCATYSCAFYMRCSWDAT